MRRTRRRAAVRWPVDGTLSPVVSAAEPLELRALLAATVINPIANIASSTNADPAVIDLANHFDDPDIAGTTIVFQTDVGDVYLEMFDDITPVTVQNFISLVNDGDYTSSLFHRSVPGFVVQGGGFTSPATGGIERVPSDDPIQNEFDNWFDPNFGNRPDGTPINVRGTISMAKLGGDPNSATTQYFVNVDDNSEILDPQNGGFTVFGRVLFNGMTVFDVINALPRVNAGSPFGELPVRNWESGAVEREHLVLTQAAQVVGELSFEVITNSNPGLVTPTVQDGSLQLAFASGQSGTATLEVRATDLQGTSVTSTFTASVGLPAKTTVTGPTGDSIPRRPTITWDAAENAETYEVWVNHVGVQSRAIHETGLTTTNLVPPSDLADGTYRVWVRTHNSAGNSGWSRAFTFVVGQAAPAATTVTGPTGSDIGPRPEITWNAIDGATEYDLWVNKVGGQKQIIREQDLTTTSYTPTSDLGDGTYRVWVQPRNATGKARWSDTFTFVIGAPGRIRVTGPTGDNIPSRPTISWEEAASGATYDVWVNQLGGQSRVISVTDISATEIVPENDLADATYRVWVRWRLPGGATSPWSAPFDFTIGSSSLPGRPVITGASPANSLRPTISWTADENAVRFDLWVNQLGGTVQIIREQNLRALTYTPASDLAAGTYQAWVRAFNADGQPGPWSRVFDFTVGAVATARGTSAQALLVDEAFSNWSL